MRRSKLYKKQVEIDGFDAQQRYGVVEAINLLKAMPSVKFDQTAEVAIRLGVDPRKSDQWSNCFAWRFVAFCYRCRGNEHGRFAITRFFKCIFFGYL